MNGSPRPLVERAVDQFGDLFVADSKRCTGAGFVEQAIHSLSSEVLAPLANRMLASGEVAEMAVLLRPSAANTTILALKVRP
ncbi:hypothetical protein [Methylobacterium oryzihabitans]|uniref:hypothetical protein n=1 Tax=Methylobacterium oryzihabitans TaxID=2499852 RepID=UPI001652812E|nr:hypothetical protein [Methylobacterium oryzihabitans]